MIYTKQLSSSSYMTVTKTLHIKSWIRLLRWGAYRNLDWQICTLSSQSHKQKRFLYFLWLCHHLSKLNLTMARKILANRVAVGLLRFVIAWILDTGNMVSLFFNSNTKWLYTLHAQRNKSFVFFGQYLLGSIAKTRI